MNCWRIVVMAMGVVGCGGDGGAGGGEVRIAWENGDSIGMSLEAPGSARWCEGGRWLEISAVRGDTGVMLALFPAESLVPGRFPVVRPAADDSLSTRPGATLGVRWFTPGLVAGYRGWRGEVEITDVGAGRTVSGRLDAGAAAVSGEGTLAVTGTFDRVPVTDADSGGCG